MDEKLLVGILVPICVLIIVFLLGLCRAPPETYRGVGPVQAALNVWVWNTTRPCKYSLMVSVPPAARHSMPLFIQHGHNSHFTDCVNLDAARVAVEEQAASETDGMMPRGLTALVNGSIWLGQSIQSYASQIINRSAADPTLTPSDSQSIDLQVDGPGPKAALVWNNPRADIRAPEGRNTLLGAREYHIPAREDSPVYRVLNLLPGKTLAGGSTESVAPANQAPTDSTRFERVSRGAVNGINAVLSG
ncbi:hypothetical protein PENPOL_c013G06613 [Penicillium polonicum]|uniref:Uncharacterized protein n=1 Tax=Penicillium polonicum TaxID=60169 RepID=A0A1V6NCJ5_PENPO|nr:hypothetical protein PENPOL_c013G06613 [Penicillium polonicum]